VAVTAPETLRNLILKHGRQLASEPDRLAGLLLPALLDQPRTAKLLVVAAGAGVAEKIARLESEPPLGWEHALELALMVDQGVNDDEARFLVAAWAYALAVREREPVPLPDDDDPVAEPTLQSGPVTAAAELRLRRTDLRQATTTEPAPTVQPPRWAWIVQAILLALAGAVFLYLAGFEFFRYGDPWSGAPALAVACLCIGLIGHVWPRAEQRLGAAGPEMSARAGRRRLRRRR
jgi:hypothetical protein